MTPHPQPKSERVATPTVDQRHFLSLPVYLWRGKVKKSIGKRS
jgi:hypothetical protein